MANHYFQFKQFKVQQEHCAMKVTTDACLFGAWCAELVEARETKVNTLLDIGTGTGLLSLMIAQKNDQVKIDAVEIDASAATEAAFNFHASPWKERLQMHQMAIQLFDPSFHKAYDFIVSNPPFFHNDLKSDNDKRNLALHSAALSLEELILFIKTHLAPNGKFAILLPHHRSDYFESLASNHHFYLLEKINIQQTTHHAFFRTMLLFSPIEKETITKEIIIKDVFNDYTPAFKALLKDYYLYL
jgi:tRNA1Val (adenine37-N6)-methyltransferase